MQDSQAFGFPQGSATRLPGYTLSMPGALTIVRPPGFVRRMLLELVAAHGHFASVWGLTMCPDWSPDWQLDPKLTAQRRESK